jgi:alpha-ketoglutarate-dependent taurine dioxygenase
MTDEADAQEQARKDAARRRRLAEIFGEVIPDQTSDDTDSGEGADRRSEEQVQEDWLKRQVPPHHG